MTLTEGKARALLTELGYDKADGFSIKVVATKIAGVPALPESRKSMVHSGDLKRLLRTLIGSTDAVRIVTDPPPLERTEAAKKRRPVSIDQSVHLQTDNLAAPTRAGNVKRKKGIQYHIFVKLLEGTQKRPIHRDAIIEYLREVFPEKSVASMSTSVISTPSWLPTRYPGYEVVKVGTDLYYARKKEDAD